MLRATLSITVISAAALVAAEAIVQAAPPSSPVGVSPGDNPKLGKEDMDFFDTATQHNLFQVKLGQLVVKQGASEDVKRFAQRMVDDHAKADQRLAEVAKKEGLSMPQELDKKHADQLGRFSQLNGAKLDLEYMNQMVSEHKDYMAAFEREAKDGKDLALKQVAASILPTLHEHLSVARQVHDRLKK
jgi:putative membrane protein